MSLQDPSLTKSNIAKNVTTISILVPNLSKNLDEVYDILNKGQKKATLVASEYIDKTRKAMGIAY